MKSDLKLFYDTTEHKNPEKLLYYFNLTPDIKNRVCEYIKTEDYRTYFSLFTPVDIEPKRPEHLPKIDYSSYYEKEVEYKNGRFPEGTTFEVFGVPEVPTESSGHFKRILSPLRNATSLSELENYPLDDMSNWDTSHMKDITDKAHAEGKVVRGLVYHIYEYAWQIRGYEQFLMDMVIQPAWAECLLERIAEQCMIKAKAYTRAGADLIHCGDDVACQKTLIFAPQMWRDIIHSRWLKIWTEVKHINPRTKIWYHSDGNIEDIVSDLVDAGLDILNPLQPECLDIEKIHHTYGNRLTFDGCIGTQTTMPFGSPYDIRNRVKEMIEKYGQNGGLILSPTHIIEPEVPIENLLAFVDACKKYGAFEEFRTH